MITVLAGGVGAARFLRGLVEVVPPAEVTAIVNTGDDVVLHGLHVSPDLDTVTYTLAGAINPETGWGLARRDVAGDGRRSSATAASAGSASATGTSARTCTARSAWREGAPLSTVTAEIAPAWGLELRLLPMTDDRVRTMVTVGGRGRDRVPGVLRRAGTTRCR